MPRKKATTANGHVNGDKPSWWRELVANIASRASLIRGQLDPRRSIDDECGYPPDDLPVPAVTYQRLWERSGLASRIVEFLAKESWQVQPTVFETEDSEDKTAFEAAWDNLGRSLRRVKSWHQDEEGSPVWEYLERVDVLSGIGRYGVLLFGLDDGLDLSQPATPKQGQRVLYLRPFPEAMAAVAEVETDKSNQRFGLPTVYQMTFADAQTEGSALGLSAQSSLVHWTRCLHVADVHHAASTSEVWAVPRLQQVLNDILDYKKVRGADAEAYWRNAMLKIFLETHPELAGDVPVDLDSIKDEFEGMMNGLQHWMFLRGLTPKPIAPAVVDPKSHTDAVIEAICICKGWPVRKFKGSERGELASSQDDGDWNGRLAERRRNYNKPRLIIPFVDHSIWLGCLPEPSGYSVHFPDAQDLTKAEQADILLKRTQSLAAYVGGNVEAVYPLLDYLTREMGLDQEEAMAIVEAAAEVVREQEEAAIRVEEAAPERLLETAGDGDGQDADGGTDLTENELVEVFERAFQEASDEPRTS